MDEPTAPAGALLPDARTIARKLLTGLAVLVAIMVAARLLHAERYLAGVAEVARAQGAAGVGVHALAFVVSALFGIPAAPLMMAAGLAYGPLGGAAVAVPANTLGAAIAFTIGRRYAGDPERLARLPGGVARAARAIGKGGFGLVFLLRLVPVAPWSVLNYAFGAAPGRLRVFVAASLLGSIPNAIAYAWVGSRLAG